ncbi:Soluble epoxide hydrolase [Anatilimnocola aggregata]|uniref:Soluble epoxide hydrolase n=1 Tax=Anatilimnocola aggregata TaxID=2528021 RepID=A0A517YN72_9BACT|nr:Soluble epoxide hydrolase [Anatilimnocola aggregata]
MTPLDIPALVESRFANGVSFECAVAGDSSNTLVILLHGFPDLWQGWHFQLPSLAAEFRVLAPNQRGYGRSDKPSEVSAYDIDQLAKDVVALADSEGALRFHVVGHDWGGIVAWWVAARYPERVKRLAVLNAPHPGAFFRYLLRSPTQLLRSWYVALLQVPYLPELLLSANHFNLLYRSVVATSQPGVFDNSDRTYLLDGWTQSGAPTAMLNYYRAFFRRSTRSMQIRIVPPALILMSRSDPTEEPGLAEASLAFCDHGRIKWFEEAAHWLQREESSRLTHELLAFLTSSDVKSVVD